MYNISFNDNDLLTCYNNINFIYYIFFTWTNYYEYYINDEHIFYMTIKVFTSIEMFILKLYLMTNFWLIV